MIIYSIYLFLLYTLITKWKEIIPKVTINNRTPTSIPIINKSKSKESCPKELNIEWEHISIHSIPHPSHSHLIIPTLIGNHIIPLSTLILTIKIILKFIVILSNTLLSMINPEIISSLKMSPWSILDADLEDYCLVYHLCFHKI